MKQLDRITMILIVAALIGPTVLAQETEQKPPQEKVEMLTANVLVLDPDGNPVEDATVYCTGLRTRVERASHWSWRTNVFGPVPKLTTNENGIVEMPYPRYVTEKLETGTMTWTVDHPDFVNFREDRSVDDDPAEIKLRRGMRFAVTAVDAESGEKIKDDLFAVVSGYDQKKWKLHENGMLVSGVFPKRQSLLRVVQIIEGQPVLFSELIEVDPDDRSRILMRNIKLSKGTRVEGKLDDSVERPVKNGFVVAAVYKRVKSPTDQRGGPWSWNAKTPIAEDGTFIFESLPPGEVVQMFPICDDWVPKKPVKETLLKFFPDNIRLLDSSTSLPQLVELSGKEVTATLAMKKSTSVRVKVTDPDENPLASATVVMWPNQIWFDGGSQILGNGYPSRDVLVANRKGAYEYDQKQRFAAKTDENGIAIINNLPPGHSESISVGHDNFEMPVSGRRRSVRVELKPDEIAEVVVTMQKKGTEALGEQTDLDLDSSDDQREMEDEDTKDDGSNEAAESQ